MMDNESEVMLNELSGIGDIASLGKTDPKEIIDAITGGIQKVRGGPSQEIPIQNVILILGGGYLLLKIMSMNLRD